MEQNGPSLDVSGVGEQAGEIFHTDEHIGGVAEADFMKAHIDQPEEWINGNRRQQDNRRRREIEVESSARRRIISGRHAPNCRISPILI